MDDLLDIFTKDGRVVGIMPKKYYYSQTGEAFWIKCCSCFVVDRKEKKILFEKRGNTLIDSGMLDLCSGHVKSGELPRVAMARELNEELGVDMSLGSSASYLGDVYADYSNLSDPTNRRNMKCIISMYALSLDDISRINIDNDEVVRYAWLSRDDAMAFISNGMTRIPYDEDLKKQYDVIFKKLDSYINKNKASHDIEEKY